MPELDEIIRDLLCVPRTWAVVGCSPDPLRDSHRIAGFLKDRGNTVVPVNPRATEILGERCYATMRDVRDPDAIDVVDIFRRTDAAGVHVDEAIEIGAGAVWMQLGVIDRHAAKRAESAGLRVIMDRCPAIEARRLGL
ncbi:MAG: CoA-binding protein [Solirubrobacteraceae bacterium]